MTKNQIKFVTLSCLVCILLGATALYLLGTQRVSFWEDESWMAIALKGDLPQVWTFAAARGVHPPLYFMLGWVYTRFTGDSEIALRWLAGMCGVVGIAWTYRLGARWYGWRAGVYAALLAAGSLFLIYFGRLARQYTLFFALAPALVEVYDRFQGVVASRQLPVASYKTAENGKIWDAVGSGQLPKLVAIAGLTAALLYTHYFGIWMAVVIGLHGLVTLPMRAKLQLIGALAVGGALFVPWVPSVLAQMGGAGSGLGYVSRDIGLNLRAYLDRIFNGDYLLGFVLTGLGVWAILRWANGPFAPTADKPVKTRSRAFLLILWLTLPLGLSLLINTRFAWFIERNMIFTLAGVYILLGAGLAAISRKRIGRWIAPVAALAFIALGIRNYDTFWPFITPDWRSLAGAMSNDARADDQFVLNGEPYSLTYYLERNLNAPVQTEKLADWLVTPTASDRVWLIDSNWDVKQEARDALPDSAVMTRRVVLGVLVAEFYQRPPETPLTVFGDQITLGCDCPTLRAKAGEALRVDLWWQALRQPDTDYSVGVYLVDENGTTVAQQDGGFDEGRIPALLLPIDHWTPDARVLNIPADLPAGEYSLTTAVYDWQTNERLLPENGLENGAFRVATVVIE